MADPNAIFYNPPGIKPTRTAGGILHGNGSGYAITPAGASGQPLVSGGAGDPAWGSTLDLSGASGGQIKFPSTPNPSSDLNTLDDYEEGSWTPIDASGAALTFGGASAGRYVKVGKLVQISMLAAYPATGSGASAIVGGLPFTIHGISPGGGLTAPYPSIPGTLVLFYAREGSTHIELYVLSGAAVTNSQVSSSAVYATGAYIAAN